MNRTAELIEYLTKIVPAATVQCAGCGVTREAVKAVIREDKFYCSDGCADRSCAVVRKQQPARVDCDGWSI